MHLSTGTPPHSAYREKCVENVVVEICSNIKYHFQKAVGSHKIRLFDFWKNNDPNFNNELGLKMLEDAQSTIFPYVIKTFLTDFINGKTGDDENQLYQYIEAKTSVVVAPFFIWVRCISNGNLFGSLGAVSNFFSEASFKFEITQHESCRNS